MASRLLFQSFCLLQLQHQQPWLVGDRYPAAAFAFTLVNTPAQRHRGLSPRRRRTHLKNQDDPNYAKNIISATDTTAAALSSYSSSSSSSPAFSTFVFDPKSGVCLEPRLFVAGSAGSNFPSRLEESSTSVYLVDSSNEEEARLLENFTLRNVPGDGDCLFLAVALATLHSMGISGRGMQYRTLARELRNSVAFLLTMNSSSTNPPNKKVPVLGIGGETTSPKKKMVTPRALLRQAARDETNGNVALYLKHLRATPKGLYGGGPELVALSNLLRRPIHIYELEQPDDEKRNENKSPEVCPIRRVATFGAKLFDDPLGKLRTLNSFPAAMACSSWDLHILIVQTGGGSADQDPSKTENHAMALLPKRSPPPKP